MSRLGVPNNRGKRAAGISKWTGDVLSSQHANRSLTVAACFYHATIFGHRLETSDDRRLCSASIVAFYDGEWPDDARQFHAVVPTQDGNLGSAG